MSAQEKGRAPTRHASRYLQQLCKHWSHKFRVENDSDRGTIGLPKAQIEMSATSEVLEVLIKTSSSDDLGRLRQVFEDHVNRFAFCEAPFPFEWGRKQ